jgi:allantoinase
MGHGLTNSQKLNGLSEKDEEKVILETLDLIEKGVGRRPKGWLGPYFLYSNEVNDINCFLRGGYKAPDYFQLLKDQFDILYEEGKERGKVMTIPLHPFISVIHFV